MKMKSFILKYVSKIMFYDVNIACYHHANGTIDQLKISRDVNAPRKDQEDGENPKPSTGST